MKNDFIQGVQWCLIHCWTQSESQRHLLAALVFSSHMSKLVVGLN